MSRETSDGPIVEITLNSRGATPKPASASTPAKEKQGSTLLSDPLPPPELLTLPGGKKTQRKKVLKLEFNDDTYDQLAKVAETIYGLNPPPENPSWNSKKWDTTEEYLFKEAKAAYDSVTLPFLKSPRVYKFESTKEQIWWERDTPKRLEEERIRKQEAANAEKDKKLAEKERLRMQKQVQSQQAKAQRDSSESPVTKSSAESAAVEESNEKPRRKARVKKEGLDEIHETFIDPFELNSLWKEEIDFTTGKLCYVHQESFDKVFEKPKGFDIWKEKLSLLEKIERKGDLSGYEYKESEKERRARVRNTAEFEQRLEAEIQRRRFKPTPLEQVEDCIYDMVNSIAERDELLEKEQRKAEKKERLRTYHSSTKGYRMKRFEPLEGDDGEVTYVLTDLDVIDMLTTPSGRCLAQQVPPGFWKRHEKEREERRNREIEKFLLAELERNRPVYDRLRLILAIARNNPKRASKEAMKLLKDKAFNVQQKLKNVDKKALAIQTGERLVQGLASLLRASLQAARDPGGALSEAFATLSDAVYTKSAEELALEKLLNDFDNNEDEMNRLMAAEEKPLTDEEQLERQKQEWRDSQPSPLVHADAVLVTFTLSLYPPPVYTRYPRKPNTIKTRIQEKLETAKLVTDTIYSEKTLLPILPEVVSDALGISEEVLAAKRKLNRAILQKKVNYVPGGDDVPRQGPSAVDMAIESLEKSGFPVALLLKNLPKVVIPEKIQAARALLTKDNLKKELAYRKEQITRSVKERYEKLRTAKVPEKVTLPYFGEVSTKIPEKVNIPYYGEVDIAKLKLPDKVDIPGFGEIELKLPVLPNEVTIPGYGKVSLEFSKYQLLPTLPPDFKYEEEEVKEETGDIFDSSERRMWEEQLIKDVSDVIALPARNIVIEEVRRLHELDTTLQRFKERNELIRREYEEERRRVAELRAQDRAVRQLLAEGKYTLRTDDAAADEVSTLDSGALFSPGGAPLVADDAAAEAAAVQEEERIRMLEAVNAAHPFCKYIFAHDMELIFALNDVVTQIEIDGIQAAPRVAALDGYLCRDGVDEGVCECMVNLVRDVESRTLIDDMEIKFEPPPPLPASAASADEASLGSTQKLDNITLGTGLHDLGAEEEEGGDNGNENRENSVQGSAHLSLASANRKEPQKPDPFVIGIRNPDMEKYNPRYWLAKDLRDVSAEESRRRRIARLDFKRQETTIRDKMKRIKKRKEEVLEDVREFMDDARIEKEHIQEELQPYYDVIKPIVIDPLLAVAVPLMERAADSLTACMDEQKIKVQSYRQRFDRRKQDMDERKRLRQIREVRLSLFPAEVVDCIDAMCEEIERRALLPHVELSVEPIAEQVTGEEKEEKEEEEEEGDEVKDGNGEGGEEEEEGEPASPVPDLLSLQQMDELLLQEQLAVEQLQGVQEQQRALEVYIDYAAQRRERLLLYDEGVVDAVEHICVSIHLSVELENSMRALQKFRYAPWYDEGIERRANEGDALVGCEVSFMISVTEQDRVALGEAGLEAEDAAVMLAQQLHDPESRLRDGVLTRHLLDVRYRLATKKRVFEKWEDYWINVIHPTFFGYTSKKSKRKREAESDVLDGGIRIANPVDSMTRDQKETLINLLKKSRKPKKETKGRKGSVVDAPEKKSLISLGNVDEFAGDVEDGKLRIYRPRADEINLKTVERCRRIYEAFEENYIKEMRRGLAEGVRLRQSQFEALKNREAAQRIYKVTKQRYEQEERRRDEGQMGELKITQITEELFASWLQEVREEERQQLYALQRLKQKQRGLRAEEQELRSRFLKQREWIISNIVKASKSPAELGSYLRVEMALDMQAKDKVNNSELPEVIRAQLNEQRNAQKAAAISEEKNTRLLYNTIIKWAYKVRDREARLAQVEAEAQERGFELTESMKEALLADLSFDEAHGRRGALKRKVSTGYSTDIISETDAETLPSEATDSLPLLRQHVMDFLECSRVAISWADFNRRQEERTRRATARRKQEDERRSAMERAKQDNLRVGKTFDEKAAFATTSDAVDADALEAANDEVEEVPPPKPAWERDLNASEMELARQVRFLSTVLSVGEFRSSLYQLPTMITGIYARDELIQFAQITFEMAPIYRKAVEKLAKSKAAVDEKVGIKIDERAIARKKKQQEDAERRKSMKEMSPEMMEGMRLLEEAKKLSGELRVEAERRANRYIEALSRLKDREAAWILAHPHKFITIPGEAPFCIICRERVYENWLNKFNNANKEWQQESYKDFRSEYLNEKAQQMFPFVEDLRYRKYLNKINVNRQFHGQVKERMHGLIAEVEERVQGFREPTPDDYQLNERMPRWSIDEQLPPAMLHERIMRNLHKAHLPENYVVPTPFLLSGLSLLDARGDIILPVVEMADSMALKIARENEMLAAMNICDDEGEPLGLKIRLWHRQEVEGKEAERWFERGAFLGQLVLGREELLDPPRGMRTYDLEDDPKLEMVGTEERTPVCGKITIKVVATKREKSEFDEVGLPVCWRLEIIRAAKIYSIDRTEKNKSKSSPYCEVLWRGPCEKGEFCYINQHWFVFGQTLTKDRTLDPVFTRNDMNMFDLPPVWTTFDVPMRGRNFMLLRGGAWVSKNNVPDEKYAPSNRKVRAGFDPLKAFKRAAWSIYSICLMMNTSKQSLREEVYERVEMLRVLLDSEERERQFMSTEEKRNRKELVELEVRRAKPYLAEQTEYAREFNRVLQMIEGMPRVLARLRFIMGVPGPDGMRITTQDPATKKFLDVAPIPVLYPEDEEAVVRQLMCLIGKQHKNMMAVVDFSVHAARAYSSTGFFALNERVVVSVLEKYDGPSMLEYLNQYDVDNGEFRLILSQIMNGLIGLHDEGVLHRNLNPMCVVVQDPRRAVKGGLEGESVKAVNARVGDYWFLYNPRSTGCPWSLGRSDWGSRMTVPPEGRYFDGTDRITSKADVYAFGVCVYYWCTYGKTLPDLDQFSLEILLATEVPARWEVWLHTLLRMCLQLDPEHRASPREVHTFLVGNIRTKKKRSWA